MNLTRKNLIENARILIVDDWYADVSLMERILKAEGYRAIASVTDSREVIEKFRVFQPDLVILDISMPRVDGFDVMAQLRGWVSEETYLPILMLTADASPSTRQKALSMGAHDFLAKPVDGNEVLLRIYNLLQTQWLYRQMQSQRKRLMEQICISRNELGTVQAEVERLIEKHAIPANVLATLQAHAGQAFRTIDRLIESAGESSIPSLTN